ncbi:MAG TPA: hypothetical protein VL137_15155 [Polyangiaceae bacterium]|nr:hypothetical protein [Polyangiaceae bacterium]
MTRGCLLVFVFAALTSAGCSNGSDANSGSMTNGASGGSAQGGGNTTAGGSSAGGTASASAGHGGTTASTGGMNAGGDAGSSSTSLGGAGDASTAGGGNTDAGNNNHNNGDASADSSVDASMGTSVWDAGDAGFTCADISPCTGSPNNTVCNGQEVLWYCGPVGNLLGSDTAYRDMHCYMPTPLAPQPRWCCDPGFFAGCY